LIIDFLVAILLSLSPLGEAKVGIPYGMFKGLNVYWVFVLCFLANVLVFPIMMFFLEKVNIYFTRWRFYKKMALFVARKAKTGSGDKIKKYGFFGLVLFVMIPFPGTGVYAGSIATYLFKIEKQKAFWANTIGIFLSSVLVWSTTMASMKGI
jgi:uncharacterized membrane protein